MLTSLVTTKDIKTQTEAQAAVYVYLSAKIEPFLSPNYGNSLPIATNTGFPWHRQNSDGTFDGTYFFHDGNWFTLMPWTVGTVCLFENDSPIPLGWTDITGPYSGATLNAAYQWRKFTGSNCLVKGKLAYRRYDQALSAAS